MSIRRTSVVSGVAALALAGSLLGASAPAFAASSPAAGSTAVGSPAASSPAAGPKSDGAHAVCLRAGRVQQRITRDLARLDGPATEVGSVARLSQRVQDAKNAGHTAIETYLQDRLTYRQSLVPMLHQRQSDLASVKTWCAANDNGKDK
ncbi:hypothetical protein GXW83_29540 [Streptacidiphilus sp. PB12-B1b]|uniref:hypothetical protein n=1 Tax=Streptacidiphilus sp. PB12-B1b TaxID=2705012 RepID=UPI0015FA1EDB|nr:hypothetical protein [Streptacidiphilus sp. PB12-B1b]QMU79233.1 hypothetical protein GXW83_29540 [Streptacidiphilus sp. PB12-B1b]